MFLWCAARESQLHSFVLDGVRLGWDYVSVFMIVEVVLISEVPKRIDYVKEFIESYFVNRNRRAEDWWWCIQGSHQGNATRKS